MHSHPSSGSPGSWESIVPDIPVTGLALIAPVDGDTGVCRRHQWDKLYCAPIMGSCDVRSKQHAFPVTLIQTYIALPTLRVLPRSETLTIPDVGYQQAPGVARVTRPMKQNSHSSCLRCSGHAFVDASAPKPIRASTSIPGQPKLTSAENETNKEKAQNGRNSGQPSSKHRMHRASSLSDLVGVKLKFS